MLSLILFGGEVVPVSYQSWSLSPERLTVLPPLILRSLLFKVSVWLSLSGKTTVLPFEMLRVPSCAHNLPRPRDVTAQPLANRLMSFELNHTLLLWKFLETGLTRDTIFGNNGAYCAHTMQLQKLVC